MKLNKQYLKEIIKQQLNNLNINQADFSTLPRDMNLDTMKSKFEYVNVDWNSASSKRKAQRQKAKLQNDGYTLIATNGGITTSQLVYKKEK